MPVLLKGYIVGFLSFISSIMVLLCYPEYKKDIAELLVNLDID